jgi:hypothetical protein
MKTRKELKAAILELERVSIDGRVDEECPWCGASNFRTGAKLNHHPKDCLWLELKNEPEA